MIILVKIKTQTIDDENDNIIIIKLSFLSIQGGVLLLIISYGSINKDNS